MGLRLWDKAGRVIAGCAGILVLAACQTAVSVEEAKQITASFEGGSFVPPPRTVGDITAILDDQKLTDPGKTGELVAKADAGPPEGEDATTLARFHLNRGQAARSIGRDSQALEDLRTAFRHLKGARLDPRERIRLLLNLASAEGSAGNHRNAVRLMERAVEAKPNPGAYRQLVGLYARGGDLGTAERAWKRGKELIARLGQRRNVKPKSLARLSIELARLDHLFLESQGRWRAAETALRRAIETRKKSYRGKGDVSWLPARQKQLARNLGKQGRFVEAEVVARGALLDALANIGRNNSITADVVRVLAGVLLTQGRYDEAEKLGRAAIDIHGRSGMPKGSRKVAQVRRFLIDVLAANEDWTGVMEEVALARADMTGNPKLLKKMFGRILGVALALLATDRAEEAQRMLSTAHDANKRRLGAKHDKTARWGALLAMAEAATGDQRAALAGFREAVPVLLSRSRRCSAAPAAPTTRTRRREWPSSASAWSWNLTSACWPTSGVRPSNARPASTPRRKRSASPTGRARGRYSGRWPPPGREPRRAIPNSPTWCGGNRTPPSRSRRSTAGSPTSSRRRPINRTRTPSMTFESVSTNCGGRGRR